MTRKDFSTQTKKKTWMKARNSNPDKWRTGFIKTSKCMACSKKLKWEDKWAYEWDHLDNNNSRNTEMNCGLLCNDCHKKNTKIYAKVNGWGGVTTKLKKTATKKRLLNQHKKDKKKPALKLKEIKLSKITPNKLTKNNKKPSKKKSKPKKDYLDKILDGF